VKTAIYDSYEEISCEAQDIIVENLLQHQSLLFCAATGSSPLRMYELLGKQYRQHAELFSQISIIKLDEWGGLPMNHPGTCESYLQHQVIQPFGIPENRYISFKSDASNPKKECKRIQHELNKKGPIDICVLGLGMNGHIAFNEPADYLQTGCHVATLSSQSLQHSMVVSSTQKPSYGFTLGMADIMQAKLIIMLINGETKKEITQCLLSQKITNRLPASYLWLHPNAICLIDKAAAGI